MRACVRLAAELKATASNRPVPLALLSQVAFVGLDEQSGIRLQLEAEFQRINLPLRFGHVIAWVRNFAPIEAKLVLVEVRL